MRHLIFRGVTITLAFIVLSLAARADGQSATKDSGVRPLVPSSTVRPSPGTPGSAPGGGAAATPGVVADISPQDRAFLQTHGRRIAEQFALIDGKFYPIPGYDRRYGSSLRLTADRWRLDNSQSQRVSAFTGLVKTQRYYPPREEVEVAAKHLPDLAAGSYGHIHSAKVVAVLGPTQMIVTDVWLVDEAAIKAERERDEKLGERLIERMKQDEAQERDYEREQQRRRAGSGSSDRDRDGDRNDRPDATIDIDAMIEWRYRQRDEAIDKQGDFGGTTLRLLGFSTATAVPGKRWPVNAGGKGPGPGAGAGPQIAIVGEDMASAGATKSKSGSLKSSRKMLVAINTQALDKSADDGRLYQLIAAAGMTPPQFAQMAQGMMREHGPEAMPLIVAAIENARLQHAASQAPPPPAPAPGSSTDAKSKKSSGSDWFKEKYGNKETKQDAAPTAEAAEKKPADAAAELEKKPNWFKEKYGKDKK